MEAKKKCVYHRGDIVYVKDLPATGGHELCGNRPAVIISSNHLNRYSDVLIVVLLTSSNVSSSPVHIPVPSKSETSVAKCEQPKSIDRKFITVPIGHISREELYAINNVTISGADFDESYNKAVAAKQKAQLEYEQAAITNKKNVEKAESDAKATKIKAQAKADAAVIKAEGNAKANKELNESLTDNVLKSLYLDKWDGALPKASLSDNNTMYDISSLTK